MTKSFRATLLLATLPLGCAPGAGSPPATPGGAPAAVQLAFAPQASPLSYQAIDSGSVRMDIPQMGTMDVSFDVDASGQLAIARAGDGLEATLTIKALKGQMSNPAAGTTGVDNSLIPRDPARLVFTPAGDVTRATLPELSRSLREVTTSSTLFRWPFVRLPHSPVRPGESWQDTLVLNDQLGALSMTQRQEITSTYAGDTVVAGRRLARIEATIIGTANITGDANGMQIEQRLVGKGTQTVLWDVARGVPVQRELVSSASGSMSVAGAGIADIPITQRTRSIARLQ